MTSGASTLAGSCAATGTAPEAVFQWTPAVSGVATIATCSAVATTFDTVVYLRTGTCGGPEAACNDDTAGCGIVSDPAAPHHGSQLTPTVTAGQTYFIVVDGYAGQSGGFALTITPPGASPVTTTTTLPSGACAAPTVIPPQGGTVAGTTSGASTQSGSCSATGTAPETVFQWTPAVSGIATIATCSAVATTFDTVVYLRAGSCGGGTEIGCNDDTPGCGIVADGGSPRHGSQLSPTVTAGQTYFILVDGYAGQSGGFALTVTPPP